MLLLGASDDLEALKNLGKTMLIFSLTKKENQLSVQIGSSISSLSHAIPNSEFSPIQVHL